MTAVSPFIHETSTATGTGNMTLSAVRRRGSDAFGTGDNGADNPVMYIHNRDVPTEYEVVPCYWSDANTMVRGTPIESSNSNAAVSFSAGTKDITNSPPSSFFANSPREKITAIRTYYVHAVVGAATFTNASDNITIASHGLSVNDPVVLSVLQNKRTFTVTIASPGVFTATAHGFAANQPLVFSTTGALPTGLTAGTTYYVISAGLTADAFQVSTTVGGAAVNTSGTQSGTHYLAQTGAMPTFSVAGLLVDGTVYYVKTVVDANNVTLATTAGGTALGTATVATGLPIYSAATGNDSNDGLAATRAGAFLTIQKAIDTALTIDLAGFDVTTQLGDSTYTAGVTLAASFVGGNVTVKGNTTTPSNVVVNVTAGTCFLAQNSATLYLQGLKLQTTTNGHIVQAERGGNIIVDANMEIGVAAGGYAQFYATSAGKITITSNYSITGGAGYHWIATNLGLIRATGITVTITGTPAYANAFGYLNTLGGAFVETNTFSGSATGKRYNCLGNGVCFTNGAATTYLPGSVAGTTDGFGVYT